MKTNHAWASRWPRKLPLSPKQPRSRPSPWQLPWLLILASLLLLLSLSACAPPEPTVRTLVVDRACSGLQPYSGDQRLVTPKEARVYIAGSSAFLKEYCPKKGKGP